MVEDAPIEVGVHLYDEEAHKGPQGPEDGALLASRLRQILPEGVRLSGALASRADQELAGSLDIAMLGHGDPTPLTPQVVERVRAAGASPWIYLLPRRSLPWAGWALKADGIMYWHWADAEDDPFDLIRPRRPYAYSVLGLDGTTWPTVDLELASAGLVDVRYAVTLEKTISRAKGRKARREVERAERLLAAVRQPFLGGTYWRNTYESGEAVPPEHLDAARQALAQQIVALLALPQKKDRSVRADDDLGR